MHRNTEDADVRASSNTIENKLMTRSLSDSKKSDNSKEEDKETLNDSKKEAVNFNEQFGKEDIRVSNEYRVKLIA